MKPDRSGGSNRAALVCADVLGAFGVSQTDLPVGDERRHAASLEETLVSALEDARDRTAFLRQTICRSPRGVDCSARHATADLERELAATFDAIGWTLTITDRERGLHVRASDGATSRETIAVYPATPLERDNLPAVLAAVNERLLFGVDAEFVLLSAGVDRWRAALIETDQLERLRASYGERIAAFERPLVPEHDLEAYTEDISGTADETGPWPAWALERTRRRSVSTGNEPTGEAGDRTAVSSGGASDTGGVDTPTTVSLIEEAEPDRERAAGGASVRRVSASGREGQEATARAASASEAASRQRDGYELVGAASVSRVDGTVDTPSAASESRRSSERTGETRIGGSPTKVRSSGASGDGQETSDGAVDARDGSDGGNARDGDDGNARAAVVSRRERRETSTEGFGTLTGGVKTARVSNDAFGADVETPTEDDRYRALGAAIGTGRNVSVRGLLYDEEFLPTLPAIEPLETRIEYDDEFDPGALPEAKAVAEESGFVWVDSGSLESTRISNG
ncbi:hypothetical protein [Natronobiforma cellulositropha]|uniref:hypothetical protein n=1 Tax=Natronobiforma cellulositropha TaxID=1679076 RepID=UPI0021D5B6A2|nr:hypothetical protein [Natronobiforma cellulositropha]